MALDAATSPLVSSSGTLTGAILQGLRVGFRADWPEGGLPWGDGGAACVSVDFDVTRPGREGPNRTGTFALAELAEKHGIPLTWAICGRTAEEDPRSYSRIADSPGGHEIGIHTYSHLDASRAGADELESDIERCVRTLGLTSPPRTFVFPWNREAHFDVLERMGFVAYRGKKRVIGGVDNARGLWNIPPVYYVDLKSLDAASLMKRYVDLCVRHRTVFHLWTHPWSIVDQGGSAEGMVRTALEPVFAYISQKREEGLLTTGTMGSLAAALAEGARAAHAPAPRTGAS